MICLFPSVKVRKENGGLWNLNGKSSNYVTLITLDFMSNNSSHQYLNGFNTK